MNIWEALFIVLSTVMYIWITLADLSETFLLNCTRYKTPYLQNEREAITHFLKLPSIALQYAVGIRRDP